MNIVDFGVLTVDKDFDTITGAEWRDMTKDQRRKFWYIQRTRGHASRACLACGFPIAFSQGCEACGH